MDRLRGRRESAALKLRAALEAVEGENGPELVQGDPMLNRVERRALGERQYSHGLGAMAPTLKRRRKHG